MPIIFPTVNCENLSSILFCCEVLLLCFDQLDFKIMLFLRFISVSDKCERRVLLCYLNLIQW